MYVIVFLDENQHPYMLADPEGRVLTYENWGDVDQEVRNLNKHFYQMGYERTWSIWFTMSWLVVATKRAIENFLPEPPLPLFEVSSEAAGRAYGVPINASMAETVLKQVVRFGVLV